MKQVIWTRFLAKDARQLQFKGEALYIHYSVIMQVYK